MKSYKINLSDISHSQWTVIINGHKYRTTRKTAFYISPILRSFSEKHPNLNSCKIEINGSEEHEELISSILNLCGSVDINQNNFEFLKNFCNVLHISLFDNQLSEYEEKVLYILRIPYIKILKTIERKLLKITNTQINKVFDALNLAADLYDHNQSEVDFKPRKSSLRSSRSKNRSSFNDSGSSVANPPSVVKSTLTVCSALFGLCISQPQNIDIYVNLLSMFPKETIEKFKRMVLLKNFDSQEVSYLARIMEHRGIFTPEELKSFNQSFSSSSSNETFSIEELRRVQNTIKYGINFHLIDISSDFNNNSDAISIKEKEKIGESFPLFFADLANKSQLKSVSQKFEYFETNLPSLSKNDWEAYKKLTFYGRNDHPIAIAIRKDDIDSLQDQIVNNSIQKNAKIKPSIFERFSLMNIGEKTDDDEYGIKLIDFAAFFGALKCFKYLLLNNFELSPMTFNYAICGGVSEIIHI